MAVSTVFWRPINLLRSQSIRANSEHTSIWGLGRIYRRESSLKASILDNVINRIAGKDLSVNGILSLPKDLIAKLTPLQKAQLISTATPKSVAIYFNENTDKKVSERIQVVPPDYNFKVGQTTDGVYEDRWVDETKPVKHFLYGEKDIEVAMMLFGYLSLLDRSPRSIMSKLAEINPELAVKIQENSVMNIDR